MSLHIFASFVTPFGTAANNRAETEGNITTLQKLLWQGETHSTVSAEAIRFALRRLLEASEPTNRTWNESAQPKPRNEWKDDQFSGWAVEGGKVYIDDDLLGFMSAQAAKEDGSDSDDGEKSGKKSRAKGTVTLRRGLLEITRAVSLTPWGGDVTFNANTPWSNLGAKDKDNPGPYGTEVHATRFQYGIALTPERLRDKSRAAKAIEALCNLGTVAGNHGRFLFDFSPDVVIFRITQDPAPRLLYCFETKDDGKTVTADSLLKRIASGDVKRDELILGAGDLDSPVATQFKEQGIQSLGVKAACGEAVKQINSELKIKG
ncbi:MAG: DevR family CRISPR-associated autoregulator [Planctomycetes bacterium]|nr:DevR family CRISPR-associated autoregulator [Planctomycetota bacterium]